METTGLKMAGLTQSSSVVAGRHVYLCLPTSEDIPLIFQWESDIETRPMWQDNNNLPSPLSFGSEFARKVDTSYHTFFLSKNLASHRLIGCVYSYGFNRIDGFMHITVFMDRESRRGMLGAETGLLFCEYLFRFFPIRKIYCVAFAYNHESTAMLKQSGLSCEGVFKKHKYFNGEYHDMYTYALYRDDMPSFSRYIH